ncbi:MAG TPA: hypothetical protein VHX60_07045 [Acidobacteriaceae bacterium]|jgi:hypothetical protein|nr:hypothetical protein [Acidobacteriaceae bacterium]
MTLAIDGFAIVIDAVAGTIEALAVAGRVGRRSWQPVSVMREIVQGIIASRGGWRLCSGGQPRKKAAWAALVLFFTLYI